MVAYHAEEDSRPIAHAVVVVACMPDAVEVDILDACLDLAGTASMGGM